MERYTEATLVCEGAVERDETFASWAEAATWATNEIAAYQAEAPGVKVEIFLLDHEHPLDVEECSCAQYQTDHHPVFTSLHAVE